MSDLSFLTIPVDLRDPGTYIEFDNSKATGALPALPRRVLILGQRLTSGTVAAGVPMRIFKPSDGAVYFGRGSMIAAMIDAARRANDSTEMWAIAQDDNGAGTAAVWNITLTGPATAAGTETLYIGASALAAGTPVQFAVASGMTASAAATALAAAINAIPDLPVTAAVDGVHNYQVDVTARHKGLVANDLDLRTHYFQGDQGPTGLGIAVAFGTAGAANPSLGASIAAMGNVWYTDIANPYTDSGSLTVLSAELERRWGATVQQDAMAWSSMPGSVGTLATAGSALNEKLLSILGIPGQVTSSWVTAAVVAAIAGYYLAIDPAAPLDTLQLAGCLSPAPADQLQHPDRESLMHDGISTALVDSGGNLLINRLITTFQTTPQGLPDTSYLSVETLSTLAYLRFWIRQRIATRWPRYKLADDPGPGESLPTGQRVTCPLLIKLDLVAGASDLVDAGIITNLADFIAEIIVQRNSQNPGQVDALLPYTLIGQFRQFAGQIQFRLQ